MPNSFSCCFYLKYIGIINSISSSFVHVRLTYFYFIKFIRLNYYNYYIIIIRIM